MDLNTQVEMLMTSNVETVSPDQKLVDVKHIYERQEFHHHIPVVENNKLVGIVSLIDFMRKIQNASLDDNDDVYQNTSVTDIMTRNPIHVNPSASLKDVIVILASGEFHALVVVDNDELKGIITTADILRYILDTH